MVRSQVLYPIELSVHLKAEGEYREKKKICLLSFLKKEFFQKMRLTLLYFVMLYKKTEGVILKIVPYLDSAKIIKIFTKDLGIISVWDKKKKPCFSLSPLVHAEFSLKKKETSDFFFLQDHTFLSAFEGIRRELSLIKAFSHMAKGIFFLQREDSQLFSLFLFLLKKLEKGKNPSAIIASFYIKMLHHEGLLHLNKTCLRCENKASSLHKGESLCKSHSPNAGFSHSDWQALFTLLSAKQFSEIESLFLSEGALSQILLLLQESTQ